jgi:hypothetical protein
MQAKGDCSDRVHSDQMVLGTATREAGLQEKCPKVLKTRLTQWGHQALVYSYQAVLVMARQAGG